VLHLLKYAHAFFVVPVTIFRRNMKKTDAAGGYNLTGLSVSLVLNHRSFVWDWKPVVWITHVLMFDVLSNEKS
jgi:hypothetical protein